MDRPTDESANELITPPRPETHTPVATDRSIEPSVRLTVPASVAGPPSTRAPAPAARRRQVRDGVRQARTCNTRSCVHQTQPPGSDHHQTTAPCSRRSLACSRQEFGVTDLWVRFLGLPCSLVHSSLLLMWPAARERSRWRPRSAVGARRNDLDGDERWAMLTGEEGPGRIVIAVGRIGGRRRSSRRRSARSSSGWTSVSARCPSDRDS